MLVFWAFVFLIDGHFDTGLMGLHKLIFNETEDIFELFELMKKSW